MPQAPRVSRRPHRLSGTCQVQETVPPRRPGQRAAAASRSEAGVAVPSRTRGARSTRARTTRRQAQGAVLARLRRRQVQGRAFPWTVFACCRARACARPCARRPERPASSCRRHLEHSHESSWPWSSSCWVHLPASAAAGKLRTTSWPAGNLVRKCTAQDAEATRAKVSSSRRSLRPADRRRPTSPAKVAGVVSRAAGADGATSDALCVGEGQAAAAEVAAAAESARGPAAAARTPSKPRKGRGRRDGKERTRRSSGRVAPRDWARRAPCHPLRAPRRDRWRRRAATARASVQGPGVLHPGPTQGGPSG